MNQNSDRMLFTRRIQIGIVLMGIGSFLMILGFHFPMMDYIDWYTGNGFVVLGNIIFYVGIIMLYLRFHKTIKLNSSTVR